MKPFVPAVVLTLSLLPCVSAQDLPKSPPAMAPSLVVLHSVEREKKLVTFFAVRQRMTAVTFFETVNEAGIIKMVPRTEVRPITEVVIESLSLTESRAFNTKGKRVEAAEALRQLKPGQAVVLSPDHNMISPAFASLLRDDVLILTRNPLLPVPPPPNK